LLGVSKFHVQDFVTVPKVATCLLSLAASNRVERECFGIAARGADRLLRLHCRFSTIPSSFCLLPNELQGELNLPWVRRGRRQQTSGRVNVSKPVENVIIAATQVWHAKVSAV
jgi:hypothetical protein